MFSTCGVSWIDRPSEIWYHGFGFAGGFVLAQLKHSGVLLGEAGRLLHHFIPYTLLLDPCGTTRARSERVG